MLFRMPELLRKPDPTWADAELVRAARDGDIAAEAALYQRHAQRVHRLALFLLGNRADAEELAQDSFATALDFYIAARGGSSLFSDQSMKGLAIYNVDPTSIRTSVEALL